MNKQNFILTSDEETMNKLKSQGFILLSQEGNFWRFINNGKMTFSDKDKVIFTNKLSI